MLCQKISSKIEGYYTSYFGCSQANNINQILFDLHASSIEDLWPGNADPPPDFVGILWNAVHKAWEGQQDKQTESPTSKVDSIVLPSKNKLSYIFMGRARLDIVSWINFDT